MTEESFRSGFAALIGRPNVGKSTLLNSLVGHKVAIMSDKPQTTRNKILGVVNLPAAQLILLDTPGIHKPKHKLGQFMVDVALNTLHEVDLVLFLVEAGQGPGPGDLFILEQLQKIATPVILLINKIDQVSKKDLLPLMADYEKRHRFAAIIPISALQGDNLAALTGEVIKYLPPGPRYYPEGMVTDRPEEFIIAEIIREKVLNLTREEVPHAVAVTVEEMAMRENNRLYVRSVVYTERDSQKGILIGKGGQMLREIGRQARLELEAILGSPIYLDVWVKVKKDWRDQPGYLRQFGYREE